MKESIDWIRAAFTGAISGGILWAVMAKVISVITHEHFPAPYSFTFISWVSLCVLIVGLVLYFCSRTSLWRSTAIGIILAPLTGWSILLFCLIAIVLPSQAR